MKLKYASHIIKDTLQNSYNTDIISGIKLLSIPSRGSVNFEIQLDGYYMYVIFNQ